MVSDECVMSKRGECVVGMCAERGGRRRGWRWGLGVG